MQCSASTDLSSEVLDPRVTIESKSLSSTPISMPSMLATSTTDDVKEIIHSPGECEHASALNDSYPPSVTLSSRASSPMTVKEYKTEVGYIYIYISV